VTRSGPLGPAGPPPGPPPGPRPPLALVFSVTVTGILANTLVNAPLPDILADFSVGDGAAGLIVAAATLPGIVVAPAIGLLADRFGRRAVLIPCLVLFGLAGVGAALAPTFGVLLALRLVQGFGSAGLINLAVVILGDHWEGAERARLIGYNAAVLTVSVAVFPAVGGALTQLGGWRWSFVPYAFALVTALAVWRLLPSRPRGEPQTVGEQVRAALAVVRRPVVLGVVAFGFVLFALIFGLFLTVLPILLADEFALEAGARGLVLAVPATTATIAALLLSRLRGRLGLARLFLVANLLFVIGFAAIGLAPGLVLVFVGALVYGFGEGLAIPSLQDAVIARATEATRAAVVAVWVGAARAGQTAGPLLAGISLAGVGPSATFLIGAGVSAALFMSQLLVPVGRWERRSDPGAAVGSTG
jgi:MFS transporter, ACDE family, multidrug resistance protein